MARRAAPSVLCVPRGDVLRPRKGETVLGAALRSGVPLASSCGGRAVCGDCAVRLLAGAETAEPPPEDELAWRARTGRRREGERLACRLRVRGDVEIATPYW